MVRTQIQLPEEDFDRLKRAALDEGVSMAELIRRGIERILSERERSRSRARLLSSIGMLESGCGDLARRHDDVLAEGDRW